MLVKFYCHLRDGTLIQERKSGKKKIYYTHGTAMRHREFQKQVFSWLEENKKTYNLLTRRTMWVVVETTDDTLAILMIIFPEGRFTQLKEKIVYELL